MPIFKKGDRVHWLGDQGMEVHGTVTRAGAKSIKAIADGGKLSASGPIDCFEKSDKPVLTFPSNMDKYSVRKYKYTGGEETPQFTAQLLLNGKKIADVSNAGRGGCNTYFGDGEAIEKAGADASIWAVNNNYESTEALDLWLDWEANSRQFGMSPKEYFGEMKQATGNPA